MGTNFTLMTAEVDIQVNQGKLQKELEVARTRVQSVLNRMDIRNMNRGKTAFQRQMNREKALSRQQLARATQAMRIENQKQRAIRQTNAARMQNLSALRSTGIAAALVGAAIIKGVVGGVKAYSDFEKAMRQATAVSDVTISQFQQMSDMAESMSVKLNINATEAANAFYFLGSAGLDVAEQLETFEATITLSRAAMISAGQAAEIMVDTLRGFKIETSKAEHVTDVLAHSVISSNMTFLQLGETLSLVAGVARSTNNTLEETVAAIQLMANVGIKGTRAGTTLRRSLLNLAAPSSKITVLFRDLGIEIAGQSGEIKPYIQLVGELNEALSDATEVQKQMAFRTLFGARAIAGQLEVFDAGRTKLNAMVLEAKLADNTSTVIAQKQMTAFGNSLGQMEQRVSKLSRSFGELLAPSILLTADAIGKFTDKLDHAVTSGDLFAATGANMVVITGGLLTAGGTLLTTFAMLRLVFLGTTVTLAGFMAVALPVTAALLAIVAVISLAVVQTAQLKKSQQAMKITIDEVGKSLKKTSRMMLEYRETLLTSSGGRKLVFEKDFFTNVLTRQRETLKELDRLSKLSQRPVQNPLQVRERVSGLRGMFRKEGFGKLDTEFQLLAADNGVEKLRQIIERDIQKTVETLANLNPKVAKEIAELMDALDPFAAKEKAVANLTENSLNVLSGILDDLTGLDEDYTMIHESLAKRRVETTRAELDKDKSLNEGAGRKLKERILELKRLRDQEDIQIETGKRSGSFGRGFSGGVVEMQRDLMTLGEVGHSVALTLQNSLGDAFLGLIEGTKSVKDAFLDMGQAVLASIMQIVAQQAAIGILGGLFGPTPQAGQPGSPFAGPPAPGTVGADNLHRGGVVGVSGGSSRSVPMGTFSRAPRLHKGLNSDEFPAILQSGERVIKRGGDSSSQPPNVILNFEDKTSQGIKATQGRSQFDGRAYVTSIILEDSMNNGPLSAQGIIGGAR